MLKLQLLFYPKYGWMLTATDADGHILYMGEYQSSYYTCLEMYETWRDERLQQ